MKVRSWLPGGIWEVNEWLAANKWQHGSGGRWHFSSGGSASPGTWGIVLKGLWGAFSQKGGDQGEWEKWPAEEEAYTVPMNSLSITASLWLLINQSQVDQVGLELHDSSKGTWVNALGLRPWDRSGQAGANGPKFFFQRKEDHDSDFVLQSFRTLMVSLRVQVEGAGRIKTQGTEKYSIILFSSWKNTFSL